MTDATRAIVDYAEQGNAKDMRDAFYNELQNRVMAHIEDKKIEVAQSMFKQSEPSVDDEEETTSEE